MSTITSLFEQAQLAEAAYSNLTGITSSTAPLTLQSRLINLQQDGSYDFSPAQATTFVAQWRVVHHIPDTTSGFSATLFQNITTGKYTFAVRGTAGGTDLSADAGDVFLDGIALDQVVDMYNYWRRLTAAPNASYQIASLNTLSVETIALRAAYLLGTVAGLAYEATLRTRSDIIIDNPSRTVRTIRFATSAQADGFGLSAATVDVNGHSLGGHLAMAFSRLFPADTNSVAAVNGAGFNFANSNVNNLFAMLGGTPGFDAGKITNVVGSAAINVVSQDWLFLQQPAGRQEIYTESIFGNRLGHGAGQMTDSLALYNLFATLDPTLNTAGSAGIQTITDILKAASNTADRSLENTLDALRTLFIRNYPDGSANLTAPATATDDRQAFYANLNALQTALVNGPFTTFNLTSLTGQSAAAMQAAAQADTAAGMAARYALFRLNPFVVSGASALYDQINTNGALTGNDSMTGGAGKHMILAANDERYKQQDERRVA